MNFELCALHVLEEHFFNLSDFLLGYGPISRHQVVKQLIDIAHMTCHTVFQHIVCVSLMSQQLRQFTTQVDEPFAYLKIVLSIVVRTLGILRHIHLTAQVALGAVSHKRRIRGEVECEHPAFLLLLLRSKSRCLTGCLRQSIKLSLIRDMQSEGFILLQQILGELQSQHRSFLRELSQTLLTRSIKQGTAAHKTVVTVVEQHLLFWRQLTVVTMYILDTLKQLFIQADVIGMLRQYRTHLLCQGIHLVVGLCREQIKENGRHT